MNATVAAGGSVRTHLGQEGKQAYQAWGYEWFGEFLPFPDAPLYDALVLWLHEA